MRRLPGLAPEFQRSDLREVDVELNRQGLGSPLFPISQDGAQWGQGNCFFFLQLHQISRPITQPRAGTENLKRHRTVRDHMKGRLGQFPGETLFRTPLDDTDRPLLVDSVFASDFHIIGPGASGSNPCAFTLRMRP